MLRASRLGSLACIAAAVLGCTANGDDVFGNPIGSGGAGGSADAATSTSHASTASSSADSTSSSAVSSGTSVSSSSTGTFCGDGICNEEPSTCPMDCGVCGDGNCGSGETCSNCPNDCGACGACPHTVCLVSDGDPLSVAACKDPCAQAVCAMAPQCCQNNGQSFGQDCQALQAQLCPNGDPCIASVCAQKPECCTSGWTQACVDAATQLCNTTCSCAHQLCTQVTGNGPLDASCNPCVAAVCTVDAYCCTKSWDDLCINEAVAVCGITCM